MRFVIQRVKEASVRTEGEAIGAIKEGFLVLIGVSGEDTEADADKMIHKMIRLRIFEDEEGKTNRSLEDIGGSLLLVSQFTLYANCKKGNRPSFTDAGDPALANRLYEYVIQKCRQLVPDVQTGRFGAEMEVSLVNDGPFTILLDSEQFK